MPDITYVGKSEGDYFDLYHLLADDQSPKRDGSERRPVLEVLVCPENKIWVAGVTGLSVPQETHGRVHRHTDAELAKHIGEANATEICLGAVAAYVIPRAVTLMARVYCPHHKNTDTNA